MDSAGAARFCCSSPDAVVLTVWPSGTGVLAEVDKWLADVGAAVVFRTTLPLASRRAALYVVMALYPGEDWLKTNCWYDEQPLDAGPPSPPYAGAKWKRELCFRNPDSLNPEVYVLDVFHAKRSLWSDKYAVRSRLARLSGNPGNSCIHLSDRQSGDVLGGRRGASAGGMACDDSYAYSCARALLCEASVRFINSGALASAELGTAAFDALWAPFAEWLVRGPAGGESEPFPPALLATADAPPPS